MSIGVASFQGNRVVTMRSVHDDKSTLGTLELICGTDQSMVHKAFQGNCVTMESIYDDESTLSTLLVSLKDLT